MFLLEFHDMRNIVESFESANYIWNIEVKTKFGFFHTYTIWNYDKGWYKRFGIEGTPPIYPRCPNKFKTVKDAREAIMVKILEE